MQSLVEHPVEHAKEKVVEQLCDGRNGPAPQEGKTPRVEGRHQTGDHQHCVEDTPVIFSGKPVSILEMYGIMSNLTDSGSEKSIFIPK